jgi:hypothetical protein
MDVSELKSGFSKVRFMVVQNLLYHLQMPNQNKGIQAQEAEEATDQEEEDKRRSLNWKHFN